MELMLVIISIVLSALCLIVLLVLLFKNQGNNSKDEIKSFVKHSNEMQKQMHEMLLHSVKVQNESTVNAINQNVKLFMQELSQIENRLDGILKTSSDSLKNASEILEKGLDKLSKDNEKKLEEMRLTVDEKLNVSLERRLTESFNVINNRLQSVYEGLGEMKQLANGVGDLKKVLTNVKTRGTWGEVQLGNLLEQMLAPNQYDSQVVIKNNERVDYVVKLPGKDDKNIYLPIDAKFPIEDYQRLIEATETNDTVLIEQALKSLEKRVKEEAKKINEKYINVPNTTDFAVMYLAIEGLYAEVLRRTGLAETLQQQYKVVVCGPTTLSALLSSLQLGFKTLSIEKRSSEIWSLLGTFKTEFTKFVELLSKTQKKLNEASNTIEFATKKTKTIQRKLSSVSLGDEIEETDLLEDSDEE